MAVPTTRFIPCRGMIEEYSSGEVSYDDVAVELAHQTTNPRERLKRLQAQAHSHDNADLVAHVSALLFMS